MGVEVPERNDTVNVGRALSGSVGALFSLGKGVYRGFGGVILTMRADTRDFDYRRFWGEAGGAGGGRQRRCHLARGGLADGAAALANEKNHQVAGGMGVHT